MEARSELESLSASIKDRFLAQKRVLSFEEYLEEFVSHPWRHSRDASRYLRDCFDHYGEYLVDRPWGQERRFRLFDQDFTEDGPEGARRLRLVGHEPLQERFYRALGNFVREGRPNRLLLLHGPNGSAKSTFAACLMRALEDYSQTESGACYTFAWVFPDSGDGKSIGFGNKSHKVQSGDSFAHLEHDRIDAKLLSELREHPLLLLPVDDRRKLLTGAYGDAGIDEVPPEMLVRGRLGRKNAEIFDALLTSYSGDIKRVLAHVQVQRYDVSRRYRSAAVTIGPEMTVDAGERQITADRTLTSLPVALGALSLFETHGELVDGEGGLIEYSDLLKRPLEAWKYLLLAIEGGEVALATSMLAVNSVLVGSTNEIHLEAFRQHPEYNSFRARLKLMRVGYLLDYHNEVEIYDAQIIPQVRRHVSPHATRVAALWAVLTRLAQAETAHYEDSGLAKIAADLSPMEKALLYADGAIPRRLGADEAKVLRAGLEQVAREFDDAMPYEGISGASPREVRTLLLDAAQHPPHACLSPLGVFDHLQSLCERNDYEFLQQSPSAGYFDHRAFVGQVREAWFGWLDVEVRTATGLVEESRNEELFERYVTQVSLWVNGERDTDPVTGDAQDPDETLFKRIEGVLAVDDADEFRRNLISVVAAHAIDHPDEPMDYARIFPGHLERVTEAFYSERKDQVGAVVRGMLAILSDAGSSLEEDERKQAQESIERLKGDFGYCDACARSALGELAKERYSK